MFVYFFNSRVLVDMIATVMFLFSCYYLLFSPDVYCNEKEWGGTDTLVYNLVQSHIDHLVCPLVCLLLPDCKWSQAVAIARKTQTHRGQK